MKEKKELSVLFGCILKNSIYEFWLILIDHIMHKSHLKQKSLIADMTQSS